MNETLIIVLGFLVLALCICFFVFGFYCRKNAVRWLEENGRYYSINTAGAFWGICVFLNITNIAYMIDSIHNDNGKGILICCVIEASMILTAFLIIREIAKKKPEKGVFKILLYMLGTVWGIAFNSALKIFGKAIDIAAELEEQRQNRYDSVKEYCRINDIRYKKIAHNGYSYEDEYGEKHDVNFHGNHVI